MWLACKYPAPAPWPLIVWNMAEKTGWTLEYIEALPMSRFIEYQQIQRGRAKAMEDKAQE